MRLQEFRLFSDTGRIDFAPVTLLFGKNNSGKTSLLRAPLLLRQLQSARSVTGDVPLSGPEVDFGSYRELVRDGDLRRNIRLEFELNLENVGLERALRLGDTGLVGLLRQPVISATLHWNKRGARAQFECIDVRSTTDDAFLTLQRDGPSAVKIDSSGGPRLWLREAPELGFGTFDLLRLTSLAQGRRGERDLGMVGFGLTSGLDRAWSSLEYIPPLRDMPARVYQMDRAGTSPTTSLRTIALIGSRRDVANRIGDSLSRLGIASEIGLKDAAPGFASLMLTMPESGRRMNLADVGFGASQVLPILTTLASATRGSLVLIEQPELHLHPAAQGALADLLLEGALQRNLALLVETHSEHIFLRMRRRLAEGDVPFEALQAYVVRENRVNRVPIDELGRIDASALPNGFFEEEWVEAAELAKAAARAHG